MISHSKEVILLCYMYARSCPSVKQCLNAKKSLSMTIGILLFVNGEQHMSRVDFNLNLGKNFYSALFHSYQKSEDKLQRYDQSCLNIFHLSSVQIHVIFHYSLGKCKQALCLSLIPIASLALRLPQLCHTLFSLATVR